MAEKAQEQESGQSSDEYTSERHQAAKDKLASQQDAAREQFNVLGESAPDVDIPAPEDRDTSQMSDRQAEAYRNQVAIAADDYEPVSAQDYNSDVFDSPDINPDAKKFQLKGKQDHVGPEAHDEAARFGVNPRTVATSSNPTAVAPEEEVEDVLGDVSDDEARKDNSPTTDEVNEVNEDSEE